MKRIFFLLLVLLTAQVVIANNVDENNDTIAEYTINGVTFKMVKVDAGTYNMGTDTIIKTLVGPIPIILTNDWERPAHEVSVPAFWIGQTEVTQELWEAVMGKNPSYCKGANRPVDNVSWNDCQKFIKKLNKLTGKNFRLPTEEEWEYAARGGNKSQSFEYSGSNNIDDVAWCQSNCNFEDEKLSDYGTHSVATKQANELGIYDMSGNVKEWCQNKWYKYDGSKANSSYKSIRGGNYDTPEDYCRVVFRSLEPPRYRYKGFGLRLAL